MTQIYDNAAYKPDSDKKIDRKIETKIDSKEQKPKKEK